MTMNSIPKFANTIEMVGVEITATSTLKTLCTGATDGSVVEMLGITTDDSAATTLELWIEDASANTFQIAAIAVAAGSGTDGTNNPINGLNTTNVPFLTKNAHGMPILNIKAGWFLKAKVETLSTGDSRKVTCVTGIRNY